MGKQITNGEQHKEPLAIVGIGLRFPMDSNNAEEFWNNLVNGTNGITTVPKDRWNADYFTDKDINKAGKIAHSTGGFIKDIYGFDNEFFNLSPYTCQFMDPQQRLLLEVTFEALQDAGLRLKDVYGSSTSVYVGGFHYDHYIMALKDSNRDRIGAPAPMGTSLTSLANRISYCFNLKGPSASCDAACSASLVGFHLACQSVWNGEAEMAIAGGVNALLRPETSIELSKGGFLGPSGLCQSFDAAADGYVRGEGGAIVILKKLKDALENNDRIYALVEGTALNHDGFKREGYTVPSTEAQADLLSTLYGKTGILPTEIDYVECHGTGTKVGDPVEVSALGQVVGKDRSRDCYIGSVKTNIGHLEGAAAIAGVIKAALVLSKKSIPPNLHFNNPRADLNLEEYKFVVPTKVTQLNRNDNKPLLAGINSFGAGGTNGHVILSEYIPEKYIQKDQQNKIESNENCLLFLLTDKTDSSLKLTTKKYIEYLKQTSNNINDICYTLIKRRSILPYQLLITGYSKEEIIDLLEQYLQGKQNPQILTRQLFLDNNENDIQGKVAFVYSGQGGQWVGMGKQLMNDIPLFKSKMIQIDNIFKSIAGWSLIEELNNTNESTSKINETHVVQPLTLAIQISLTHLWKEYFGVQPDGVIGHSIGEVAAAYASGTIDLDTAVFIIYQRSTIQKKLSGKGKMLAVGINETEANKLVQRFDNQISIATMNGPRMLTVAGDADCLDVIATELESKHIFNAFVKTQVPYHTSIMEQIKDDMINTFQNVKSNKPIIELYSSVTSKKSEGFGVTYWYENVRKPVLFIQTIEQMINDGYTQFIEIGPHPVLTSGVKQLFNDFKMNDALAISSTKRKSETPQLFQNLGIYFIHNSINNSNPIDSQLYFQNIFPNAKFLFDFPHNTWEHKQFTVESNEDKYERLGFKYNGGHPFLRKDYGFHSINTNQIWEANINVRNAPYLSDHVVNNAIVFPAVGYMELALAVGNQQEQDNQNKLNCFIEDITFESAIILPEEKMEYLNTRLEIISPERDFVIYTKADQQENSTWSKHTTGKINITDQFKVIKRLNLNDIKSQFEDIDLIDVQDFYSFVDTSGLFYGKYFQCIKQLWYNDSKILSKVVLAEDIAHEAKDYYLHPALFDAALHGVFAEHMKNGISELYLPHSLERVSLLKRGCTTLYAYIEVVYSNDKAMKSNIWMYSEDGELVSEFYGLLATNLTTTQSENSLQDAYEYKWIEKEFSMEKDSTTSSNLVILADQIDNEIAQQISANLSNNDNYKFNNIQIIDQEDKLKNVPFDNQSVTFVVYVPSLSPEHTQWEDKAVKYLNLVKLIGSDNNVELRLITQNSTDLIKDSKDNQTSNNIKLDHALLCGMSRVIQNEYPNLNCKFVDINQFDSNIFNDLFYKRTNQQDNEIMFRNGKRYVRCLVRLNNENIEKSLTKESYGVGTYYRLEQKDKGLLDSLVFREVPPKPLRSNEIEISVHATGINFKDILNVTGRLTAKAVKGSTAGNLMGLEVSGTVLAKGSDVNDFEIGDEIVAGTANGFAGRVTTLHQVCIKKPKFLSHVECATIPVAYATAWYGLKYLAKLTNEDTILIHSAAGGVGVACINVAKYFGAKIIATVSTKSKREFLEKEFGIPQDHIFDSRTNQFYDQIMNLTNGQGVDVIMNFLGGSLLDQTIKCLNHYGRFVEIGKSAIYDNKPLNLERFGNNISYFVEDIDRLSNQKPKLYKQISDELGDLFQQGHLKPIKHSEYSINDISSAFKAMMKGDHIGKLVVNMENQTVTTLPQKDLVLPNKGVFIITGGASGFGLVTARWLVEKGVNQLVLVSRSGTKSERDRQIIEELKSEGVTVELKNVDITSLEDVKQLFKDVNDNIGFIKGIVHGATIMHDLPIEKMEKEGFLGVIQTKAIGALNLHYASLDYSNTIEYFLMCSSISSTVGISSQVNYVAANYFLDILAEYRQQRHLPGTSVNLGLLGEYAGLSKGRSDIKGITNILSNQGLPKMPLHTVLNLLESTMIHKPPSRVTAFCQWDRLKQSFPSINTDLRFNDILNNIQGQGKSNTRKGLREKVGELKDNNEAIQMLKPEICSMFAKVLNLTGTDIAVDQSMDKLGFDSLSYTQVRTWLLKNLNINYPIMKLMKGASIQTLVEDLVREIKSSGVPTESQTNTTEETKHSQDDNKPHHPHRPQKSSIPKPVHTIVKPSVITVKQESRDNVLMNGDTSYKLENGVDHPSNGEIKSVDQNQNGTVAGRKPRASLSLNNAHVLGIGTSNPPTANYTKEVFQNVMKEYQSLGISDSDRDKVEKFYEHCGIEKKYCHDDFSKKTFTENTKDEYYNTKYKRIVPDLSIRSSTQAIQDWGGDVKTITHVVSCSCTGVIIPDINFLLIKALGLNPTIERISVNLMGCFGGITTLKTAKALALQNPKYRVLMVCTEVSSIHYRPLLEIDSMLACAIFGDGSAAMIIGCNPTENEKQSFELIQTGSYHIPDTEDLMGWDLRTDAWLIGLSPLIPIVFGEKSAEIMEKFLKDSVPFKLTLDECDWLMHPGGKSILLSLQESLNIPIEKNLPAWNVLRDYGNMSSATILFVMDEARKYTPKENFSMGVAFGPGLSVEIALMRKL